jgi:hypothetical protein
MNLPGFSADASLYKTSGHYRLSASAASMATVRIGLAQVRPPLPDGFPDGQFCRPGCGPCVPDPDSATGCSRTCITPNCNDFTRPCTGCRPPPVCTCTTTRCCDGNCTTSAPVSC